MLRVLIGERIELPVLLDRVGGVRRNELPHRAQMIIGGPESLIHDAGGKDFVDEEAVDANTVGVPTQRLAVGVQREDKLRSFVDVVLFEVVGGGDPAVWTFPAGWPGSGSSYRTAA